jgi:transposase-like protein
MIADSPKPPQTLLEAVRHFDAETARQYVQAIKWPDGPVCPKCGSVNVGTIKSRNGMHQCREKQCRCQFSLIKGTIFEGTHLRLDQWCLGVWQIVNCKNGVSSCEMARSLGISQTSAWHLLHRVRWVIQQNHEGMMGETGGGVEADTTYMGGLMKFMTEERRERARRSYMLHGKAAVHGLKDRRTGTVRAKVLGRETGPKVHDHIQENVSPRAFMFTDTARIYDRLGKGRFHLTVNHRRGEFVRGSAHTNGLESFWNCLRRGCKGTYVRPSADRLQYYVDEQVWRFNMRKLTDWERFEAALRLIVGKRLTYKTLTDGATR